MAFDPTKPANGAPIVSAELRNQFNALNTAVTDVQSQVNSLPSASDINDTINSNAAGPVNGVSLLNLSVSNPPTQAQVQAIANKLDEVITALQRL